MRRRDGALSPRGSRGRGEGPNPEAGLDALQARIGHFFRDPSQLRQALTHPSATSEEGVSRLRSYERLEFLGDALVNLYVAALLFDLFPSEEEGVLTRLRAYWVSRTSLARTARELGLGDCLRLGAGEEAGGGREKARTLSSALEALFGALYVDAGHRRGMALARKLWREPVRKRGLEPMGHDTKTALQELRQAGRLSLPDYRTGPEGGGFLSVVYLDEKEFGRGRGPSRKSAEQEAARAALAALRDATSSR